MQIAVFIALASCGIALGAIAPQPQGKSAMLESNRVPKTKADLSQIGVPNVPAKAENNAFCPECEAVILELVNVLKNPDDVNKLKAALKEYCPYTALVLSEQECENIIDNDLEAGLHQLIPYLENAEGVCTDLGFCESGETADTNPMKPVFLHLMKAHVKSLQLNTGLDSALCDDCQFMVQEAVTLLDNQQIQDTIKQELEQYCTNLQTFKDECVSIIDQYFPMIIAKIKEFMGDSKAVCTDLGLCSSNGLHRPAFLRLLRPIESKLGQIVRREERRYPRLELMARVLPRLQTRAGNAAGCIACETAFIAMLGILQGVPATQVAISNDVIALCKKVFPVSIADQCDGFLSLYGPTAVHVAMDQLNANQICKALNACSTIEAEFAKHRAPDAFKGLQCEACEGAVQFLKLELQTPAVQNELVQLGTEICEAIPAQYKDVIATCRSGVQTYVPPYVYQMGAIINNFAVCQNLQIC